jgi:hypothetical protein
VNVLAAFALVMVLIVVFVLAGWFIEWLDRSSRKKSTGTKGESDEQSSEHEKRKHR